MPPSYGFTHDPSASEQLCGHCKSADAEMQFNFSIAEDDYDEDGFCCLLCAMSMVAELSDIKRSVEIRTSDNCGCTIQTAAED
jgi:hypothetical protein